MDQISYAHSAKQSKRIKRFIAEPDSTSGLVSLPKVIEAGENITIPDGRVVVHPNLEIDGTLTIENDGELFVPFGGTIVSSDLMHPVDTIDDLRNETGKYKYIYVTGYHTKDDGAFGSNMFVWDEDSTETDNGGTIIKCTTVTTGRYKLKYSGAVNIKWFGAVGDGTTDDSIPAQNAINLSKASIKGLSIYCPAGKYLCNIIDNGTKNVHIFGDGKDITTITSYSSNSFAIKLERNFRNTLIEDITISGVDKTKHGVYINTGSNAVFNNVKINYCGLALCSNSTINVEYNKCEFSNNYSGTYLTTRTVTGSLNVTDVNGQTVALTDAYFVSHPSCHYFNNCLITLNTIGFLIDQTNNPYQKDCLVAHTNCIIEANKLGVAYINLIGGYNVAHMPKLDNTWFENNKSTVDILFNGATYTIEKCGDIYQSSGQTTLSNCSINKWYSENSAESTWYSCSIPSETSTIITNDSSSIYCDVLSGENANTSNANLLCSSVITTSNRTVMAKIQPPISMNRNSGTLFSTKSFNANSNLGYGATVINVADGVFETLECKEYTATGGNGTTVSNGSKDKGKYFLNVFSCKLMSGTNTFRYINLGGDSPFTPVKTFTMDTTWKTYAIVSKSGSAGTGSNANIITPTTGGLSVYRVSGSFTIKFNTSAELIEFLKKGLFGII